MAIFFENDPTLQSYWRSIILYGRNVASYKFALGKALIDLNKNPNDLIKLEVKFLFILRVGKVVSSLIK